MRERLMKKRTENGERNRGQATTGPILICFPVVSRSHSSAPPSVTRKAALRGHMHEFFWGRSRVIVCICFHVVYMPSSPFPNKKIDDDKEDDAFANNIALKHRPCGCLWRSSKLRR